MKEEAGGRINTPSIQVGPAWPSDPPNGEGAVKDLVTFPSFTYRLLPSPRRFPAILLTSISVTLNTLPYLEPGDQTALGTLFNPHHRSIRRSRFELQIEHHGLSSRRSLAQFIYKRVIDSCTAPSACPGSRLSEASPSSVANDTRMSVLFTLQIISVTSVRRCASLRTDCTLRCLEADRLRRYLSRENIWRAV
jgi:hypothetical protein